MRLLARTPVRPAQLSSGFVRLLTTFDAWACGRCCAAPDVADRESIQRRPWAFGKRNLIDIQPRSQPRVLPNGDHVDRVSIELRPCGTEDRERGRPACAQYPQPVGLLPHDPIAPRVRDPPAPTPLRGGTVTA